MSRGTCTTTLLALRAPGEDPRVTFPCRFHVDWLALWRGNADLLPCLTRTWEKLRRKLEAKEPNRRDGERQKHTYAQFL